MPEPPPDQACGQNRVRGEAQDDGQRELHERITRVEPARDGWSEAEQREPEREGVRVGTASAPVVLGSIQAAGKKPMNAADWARGARLDEAAQAQ